MLRRFAEGYERPEPDQAREWFLGEMVTDDGEILCDEARAVLHEFFDAPDQAISAIDLGRCLFINPFHARSLCRQLAAHGLIEESPPFSTKFQLARDKIEPLVYERIKNQLRPMIRKAA